MTQQPLLFSAAAERQLVATEVASQRTIEWLVEVPAHAERAERAPLNLALVIDRSGSMHGEKLRYVQQAACHVLDMLGERDRVALVAYDDQITLLSASTPVSELACAELKRAINALAPGGWTDLSGGWLAGCREIAQHQAAGGINRALLLTDGLANRGITDVEQLTQHARELRQRGIATSAFGVGLDFNENLLEALAQQGGGHFYYIERPDQIPAMFRRELGELLTITAREVFVTIAAPAGVAIELLGDLPHEHQADRLRVFLGDLCADERRAIYTRVLTPPDAPGTSVIVRGALGYADLEGRTATLEAQLAFSYAREAEVLRLPPATGVLERAGLVEVAAASARAVLLERAGQRRQAQALLEQTLAGTAPYMAAPAAAQYQALAEQIGGGLSEDQRKGSHFAAYRARTSRE